MPKLRVNFNWQIWLVALGYGLLETAFFGWHAWPQSVPELYCDGITCALFALAYYKGGDNA